MKTLAILLALTGPAAAQFYPYGTEQLPGDLRSSQEAIWRQDAVQQQVEQQRSWDRSEHMPSYNTGGCR